MTKAQFRAGRVIHVPPPPASPIDDRDLLSKVDRAAVIEDQPLENLPAIPPPAQVPPLEPVRDDSAPPLPETVSPVPAAAPPAAPAPVAERAPAPVRVAPAGRPVPARPAPADSRPAFHVVKRGETLFAIAERYGLDLKELKRLNKIKRGSLVVGQRLRLRR
jgi:nucleoid-associated protein YgaU